MKDDGERERDGWEDAKRRGGLWGLVVGLVRASTNSPRYTTRRLGNSSRAHLTTIEPPVTVQQAQISLTCLVGSRGSPANVPKYVFIVGLFIQKILRF